MNPWTVYLDARQAQRNDAVPATLRTASARRLVRNADAGIALSGAGVLTACGLLGVGVVNPIPYVVAVVATAAGVTVTARSLRRLGASVHDGAADHRS